MTSVKPNRDLIDIHKDDLYGLLNVPADSDKKTIQRAYRKKALKYHPDKNPDPAAHKVFLKLTQVLELLTDDKSRTAYDTVLAARAASSLRNEKLDAKRRKLKDRLEEREKGDNSAQLAEKELLQTIKRLQSEGESILLREQQKMREDFQQKTEYLIKDQATLKLKWKCSKDDKTNGGYNFKVLRTLLSKYGNIEDIIVSSKRNGSAIVVFNSIAAAKICMQKEKGLEDTPLKFRLVHDTDQRDKMEMNHKSNNILGIPKTDKTPDILAGGGFSSFPDLNSPAMSVPKCEPSGCVDKDYESLVMMRLRQAEERKRIIEEMKVADHEED